jgi:hypothetical protein
LVDWFCWLYVFLFGGWFGELFDGWFCAFLFDWVGVFWLIYGLDTSLDVVVIRIAPPFEVCGEDWLIVVLLEDFELEFDNIKDAIALVEADTNNLGLVWKIVSKLFILFDDALCRLVISWSKIFTVSVGIK